METNIISTTSLRSLMSLIFFCFFRLDKEQALAEETRATLAALDAMRKAHESEVRREVDKFKAEFLSRGAHATDLGQISSRHQ